MQTECGISEIVPSFVASTACLVCLIAKGVLAQGAFELLYLPDWGGVQRVDDWAGGRQDLHQFKLAAVAA